MALPWNSLSSTTSITIFTPVITTLRPSLGTSIVASYAVRPSHDIALLEITSSSIHLATFDNLPLLALWLVYHRPSILMHHLVLCLPYHRLSILVHHLLLLFFPDIGATDRLMAIFATVSTPFSTVHGEMIIHLTAVVASHLGLDCLVTAIGLRARGLVLS